MSLQEKHHHHSSVRDRQRERKRRRRWKIVHGDLAFTSNSKRLFILLFFFSFALLGLEAMHLLLIKRPTAFPIHCLFWSKVQILLDRENIRQREK
uniref:Transmembrane protein n=1 Tax=Rhizophora mucronata TaxID=61149 RepID=A0A2P2LDM5_RHIMU